jgi:hypothetical protein
VISGTLMHGRLADFGTSQIGGVPCITFRAARPEPADLGCIARPSPYVGFEHRVDQAIMRDIVVAMKP